MSIKTVLARSFDSPACRRVAERLVQYALLVRLHRPIGIYLLLWPALWALWVAAGGVPDLKILAIFVAGVVLMRSAGCAINDYADRDFDPHVERTRERPIAAGRIAPAEALAVFLTLTLAAFILVLFTNALTVYFSFAGALLAATYPYMKRFHYLPQVHLGAAFGWAVPMAFTAQTGALPPPVGWLIFIAAVLWATIYDTMYAMADRDDDLKIGVKSTAILFGEADRAIIALLQGLFFIDLLLVGYNAALGGWYYASLAAAALFAGYQQWLIRQREPRACFRAFLNNNYLGLTVFIGVVLDYAL